MSKVTLPTSVRVGYMTYKIVLWDTREATGARRYGETCHCSFQIKVDAAYGSRKAANTLLHEILHAVYYAYELTDEDKEERTVATIANALVAVWRDNPDVLEWIGTASRSDD